jgi:O-antigen ligase
MLSFLWSDFPAIALKRWFRDLGTYLTILVALSELDPLLAVKTLLRRLFYLVIPLSIVFIKYFPDLARQYDQWTGVQMFVGITTSKNMLGVACLISGLFFFWDTLSNWSKRNQHVTKWTIRINILFFALTIYLLSMAHSATSSLCLVLGCAIVLVAQSKTVKRNPAILTASIPAFIVTYILLEFAFQIDLQSEIAAMVGRDPTLTGRTHIWEVVLSVSNNPLLGTGYETFWVGPRLIEVWSQAGMVNQAHNGYLELYLNLGLIGLFLLSGLLISSYKAICAKLNSPASLGSFALALWTILLFYNITEAAFRGQLIFVTFFLCTMAAPSRRRLHSASVQSAGTRGHAYQRA